MELIRGGALILAVILMGIMTGIFQVYSYSVMRGLKRVDDRTFVGAFQELDRAIMNPLFLVTFLGAFGFTVVAMVTTLGETIGDWILTALVLYTVTIIITARVNVPLNNVLKAAGDPDSIDAETIAAAREFFDEARWTRWNNVRAVACTAAFVCLIWATVLYGRVTA